MGSLPPTAIAIAFLVVVAVAIVVGIYVRGVRRFVGFRELTLEARELERLLDGEIFRDGSDLVVSGNFQDFPTIIRFSKLENTPGVNVRMSAPASFTLSVAPKGLPGEGRVVMPTGDGMFDARFVTRSDHPTQAKMFLTGKVVVGDLQKLCCSARTFFGISTGSMELSELAIPQYPARHLAAHLKSMAALASALRMMPGAHAVKIKKMQREGRWVAALSAAALLCVAVAGVLYARMIPAKAEAPPAPVGIVEAHASELPDLAGWRLATEEDFDREAAAWVRRNGQEAGGRIFADFSGNDREEDAAYLLVNEEGGFRLALLVGGKRRFASQYEKVAIAARIPRRRVADIRWLGVPPSGVEGDGLLIVRNAQEPASGLMLFASGTGTVSGIPADYREIALQ